jgi:hypothetical protein
MPIIAYIVKLQHYLNKYPQNIKDKNFRKVIDLFYLDKLKQTIILSLRTTTPDEETKTVEQVKEDESKFKPIVFFF